MSNRHPPVIRPSPVRCPVRHLTSRPVSTGYDALPPEKPDNYEVPAFPAGHPGTMSLVRPWTARADGTLTSSTDSSGATSW